MPSWLAIKPYGQCGSQGFMAFNSLEYSRKACQTIMQYKYMCISSDHESRCIDDMPASFRVFSLQISPVSFQRRWGPEGRTFPRGRQGFLLLLLTPGQTRVEAFDRDSRPRICFDEVISYQSPFLPMGFRAD